MGLDRVEFWIEIETTFGVRFSDSDFQMMATPRGIIDYLHQRLPKCSDNFCLSQRAFYMLRSKLMAAANIPKLSMRPSTRVRELFPDRDQHALWNSIYQGFGVRKGDWPSLRKWSLSRNDPQLCDAVRIMVAYRASALYGNMWTRKHIADAVHALMENQFGLAKGGYTDDSRFFEDLGID